MPVRLFQALIDIVPDEASLIQRLLLCQIRIFSDRPAGIPHGVSILTVDIGFIAMLRQPLFDIGHMGVHGALDIRNVKPSVMTSSLIVYRAEGIQTVEKFTDLYKVASSERLIPA